MSDTCRVPERKVRDYLLNPDHPAGGPKSAFFRSLGFERSNYLKLSDALTRHFEANTPIETITTPFGHKLILRGVLSNPAHRTATVRTVWIVSPQDPVPTFVTAVPD